MEGLWSTREGRMLEMSIRFFYLEGKYFKAFVGLTIFSLLYILPIVLANFYYIDDLGRSLRGYTGWNSNGRPLLSLLAIIFSDGKPLMDISPWIQVAAGIVFNYSLVIYIRKYVDRASAFGIFCIGVFAYLNLFLLENFSYKYDSLGMLLSISLYFVLFSLPHRMNKKMVLIASIVAVLLSSSLYQAAIGAYLSLALLEALWNLYEQKSWSIIIKEILIRVAGFLAGSIIYKLTVVKLYVKDGYSLEHAGMVNVFSHEGIERFVHNVHEFASMFQSYGVTIGILGILLLLTLCIGLGYIAYTVWNQRDERKSLKILSVGFVFAVPILLVIASVMALILLKSPIIAPRVMLSFTVFTLFIGFVIYRLSEVKKGFLTMAILSMICILSFSSYYGNLLTNQEKMNHLVASYIVHDMNELEEKYGRDFDKVIFVGSAPRSHELSLAIGKRPLFGRLIPIVMNNDWHWGGQYLSHYRMKKVDIKSDSDDKQYIDSVAPDQKNEFYQMYVRNDKVIVAFRPCGG